MQQGQHTSPETVAVALAAREAGATLEEAGSLIDAPKPTVYRYEMGQVKVAREAVSLGLVTAEKRRHVKRFWRLARSATDQAQAEVGKLGGYQAALVAAIAVDKALVLEASMGVGGPSAAEGTLIAIARQSGGAEVLTALAALQQQIIEMQAGRLIEVAVQADSTCIAGSVGEPGAEGRAEDAEILP